MKKQKRLIYGSILKTILLSGIIFIGGCANQKPALAPTQQIDGKSIIVPPEFDVIPDSAAAEEE